MAESPKYTEEAHRAVFFDKGHSNATVFPVTMSHLHDSLSTVVHSGLMLGLGKPGGGLQGAARGD